MNVLFTCYCLNDPLDVIGATVPTELRERERELLYTFILGIIIQFIPFHIQSFTNLYKIFIKGDIY